MATWHDEELPPDETLRVLAGREPTWRFKIKRVLLYLWGAFLALVTWCVIWAIFVGFSGSDRWFVFGFCILSYLGGIYTCKVVNRL
jgi:hypothetical protein